MGLQTFRSSVRPNRSTAQILNNDSECQRVSVSVSVPMSIPVPVSVVPGKGAGKVHDSVDGMESETAI